MYFFRCGDFLGCKAGLSLLLVFFPASAVFFLASDGFFPPRMVFSRCLQNAFFLLQRCFLLLQGVFSAALNFSRCEAAFFAGVFSRCGDSFSPLHGLFFLLPNVFFSFPMFFPAANLCFSRAARRQGARERRVIHWAFATCKLDSAWTYFSTKPGSIETNPILVVEVSNVKLISI